MCGRYLFISEEDELKELLYLASFGSGVEPEPNDFPSGEIFPGTRMPVITDMIFAGSGDGLKRIKESVRMELSVWGIPIYGKKKDIINARRERIMESPLFSELFRSGRCVIPASGYFEWKHSDETADVDDNVQLDLFGGYSAMSGNTKKTRSEKYLFTMPDSKIMYMAGLSGIYGNTSRFAVITGNAEGGAAEIHDRMPLILTEDSVSLWLNDERSAISLLEGEIPEPRFALAG